MSSRAKNSERLNFISKLSKNSAGSIADFKRLSRSFVKALRRFAHKVQWVFPAFFTPPRRPAIFPYAVLTVLPPAFYPIRLTTS
ncbi:hypothetical protein RO04_06200 [Aggregatibacter actinomycetemcomitans]|uniref:Uncharacterized protein n=1 Tax=Aggregatibacter actinomycetemcomitans TaxID=714 RepID=A0A2G1DPE3_AGGAC|nr:hypothetical protein RO04_06200 [Aggregatibacter actinomycetemcomitans]PHO20349.1 hypothetical protein CQR80_07010 [Aggregatibacter actinomycetemcomitans]PHO22830.1 hypothetical protein CQR79_05680 [Aggregatibacter actinomycetemcomitans]TYA21390.1 hypothetical protein FXE08_05195 [Aggregatibacter actinomycetemcomitans]